MKVSGCPMENHESNLKLAMNLKLGLAFWLDIGISLGISNIGIEHDGKPPLSNSEPILNGELRMSIEWGYNGDIPETRCRNRSL